MHTSPFSVIFEPFKPLPFRGGVGVGESKALLDIEGSAPRMAEKLASLATTPTPPLKRRG